MEAGATTGHNWTPPPGTPTTSQPTWATARRPSEPARSTVAGISSLCRSAVARCGTSWTASSSARPRESTIPGIHGPLFQSLVYRWRTRLTRRPTQLCPAGRLGLLHRRSGPLTGRDPGAGRIASRRRNHPRQFPALRPDRPRAPQRHADQSGRQVPTGWRTSSSGSIPRRR